MDWLDFLLDEATDPQTYAVAAASIVDHVANAASLVSGGSAGYVGTPATAATLTGSVAAGVASYGSAEDSARMFAADAESIHQVKDAGKKAAQDLADKAHQVGEELQMLPLLLVGLAVVAIAVYVAPAVISAVARR